MNTGNNEMVAEAKVFAAAMLEKKVGLSVAQGQIDGRTTTDIRLTDGKRRLRMYAEADPECYSDLSKVIPMSRHGFILAEAAVSDYGIMLKFEDEKSGARHTLRVLLSKHKACARILSFECALEKTKLKAVA